MKKIIILVVFLMCFGVSLFGEYVESTYNLYGDEISIQGIFVITPNLYKVKIIADYPKHKLKIYENDILVLEADGFTDDYFEMDLSFIKSLLKINLVCMDYGFWYISGDFEGQHIWIPLTMESEK